MFENSAAKHAVFHPGGLHFPETLMLDRGSFRPPLAAIAVQGDLTIDGDLLSDDPNLDTILFVTGSLRLRHMVKAWMPVFVLGDLSATGLVMGRYQEGLLRVGGDLSASGYVRLCADWPSMKGHVIGGQIRAKVPKGKHERFFVPEVITRGSLDPDLARSRHDAGLPIWLDAPAPAPPKPKPLKVKLTRAKLPSTARTIPADEANALMLDHIQRAGLDVPFSEFAHVDGPATLLPDGAVIEGDLILDGKPILCDGTLQVTGDIVNDNLDSGPLLFAAGGVHCANIRKGGSAFVILGSVRAEGVVIAEYNHGVMRVGGDLAAKLFLVMDHDAYVAGKCDAAVVDTDEDDPAALISADAFLDDELRSDRVHALARSGQPLLR